MAFATQADVRKQIASAVVAPIYLLVGADEAAKIALAGEFLELVETDLRAFNVDRLYGGETTAAQVVDAANTLPMMVPRRVVLLLHAERLLNPKKDNDATSRDLETLEAYVKTPVDTCCLVLVAESVDKRRALAKQLLSRATVVECTGPADAVEAAKWVKDRVAKEGMTIDARAARLVADRVGPDVSRLRSDVERLVLYATGNKVITEADVKEVVAPATSQDDWAVTNAIARGSAGDALRELGLMMDNGAVPYMILGQLAWFVRTKVPAPKVSSAVEAVFRTDLAIKTSAGDPRTLLERLVVELCGR
ncbi:MAG TPA: DNA polymerase III subunit delta [Vicinamibacterales bacterium]|nr:DNA polymerase III subunit delta [Vicinamibacterales bacterium]